MEMSPPISIELKLAENLKPEVRNKYKLPAKGLVIKKVSHASPLKIEYIVPEAGFSSHLADLLEETDMQDFVELARQRL